VCCAVLGFVVASGCGVHRDLRITEVGNDMIELYLDEPGGNRLSLDDAVLSFTTSGGKTNSLDLGAFGQAMTGGTFLIVWEDSSYRGAPVAQDFSGGQLGAVPGIKVARNFFDDMDSAAASEVILRGRHSRGTITDLTDDCVRFGDPMQRVRTGGTFHENDTITNPPGGSASIQRRFDQNTGAPIDTDSEADWVQQFTSWGVATQ
jgi:hypothetical protein